MVLFISSPDSLCSYNFFLFFVFSVPSFRRRTIVQIVYTTLGLLFIEYCIVVPLTMSLRSSKLYKVLGTPIDYTEYRKYTFPKEENAS